MPERTSRGHRSARGCLRGLALGRLLRRGAPSQRRRLRRLSRRARKEALERRPEHPAVLYNVGRAKLLLGRPDEAIVDIRRALELNPLLRDYAASDEDVALLRERADWPG